jgi:AcrR family transcriptional regulator
MPKIVDHAARRAELSGIAAGLIAGGGLEAATIRKIARASGYSKGVVEHYFEDKQELISAALAHTNLCFERRVTELTLGLQGLSALRRRIEATLPMRRELRDEWRVRLVFWSMAAIDPALRRQQAQRFRKAVRFYEQDIVAAIEAGELAEQDDSTDRARHLVNMTTGISIAALHNETLYTRSYLSIEIDYLIDALKSGKF